MTKQKKENSVMVGALFFESMGIGALLLILFTTNTTPEEFGYLIITIMIVSIFFIYHLTKHLTKRFK